MHKLLSEATPPSMPVEAGFAMPWSEVESDIGTTLPADYKSIIEIYGSGDFCDLLVVLNPFSASQNMNLRAQIGPVLEIYQDYREAFPERCNYSTYPKPDGLLPIAQDTNGNDLFYVTNGPPINWTLVHYNWRAGCLKQEYKMPLVSFLAGWISGRWPESFFGVGNASGIIRRDPIFRPLGHVRPSS